MRLIHQHIERLTAGKPDIDAPEAGAGQLHEKVVQIRFNAWHYAETNLWASLVGHIFQELAKATEEPTTPAIFGELHTAQELTLDAAKALVARSRERAAATEAYQAAKADAEVLRYRVDPVAACKAAIVEVFNDGTNEDVKEARTSLEEAAQKLGLGQLAVNAGRLTESGTALLNEGISGRQALVSMVQRFGSPGFVLAFIAFLAIAGVAIPWCLHWGIGQLDAVSDATRTLVTGVASVLLLLSGVVNYLTMPVRSAVRTLRRAKVILDGLAERRRQELEAKASLRNADLESADIRLKAAAEHLKATMEKLASVNDELHSQTPAHRLTSFVRARASDGTYAQHLGLVSAIRRDFEQLSSCLAFEGEDGLRAKVKTDHAEFRRQVAQLVAEARETLTPDEQKALLSLTSDKPPAEFPFRRIVLYIDDVDRCPPEKVIEVLQAVHMLLAFRLFVVFVAVDVRWVESSLVHQYPGMLKDGVGGGAAPASDYLEKIFQLPYWVPGLSPSTSSLLLRDIFGSLGEEVEGEDEEDASPNEELELILKQEPVAAPRFEVLLDELPSEQISVLRLYGQFIKSPRQLLRLANVMRLLNVGDYSLQFVENPLHIHALVVQLTIATAAPALYTDWFKHVTRAFEESKSLQSFSLARPEFMQRQGGEVIDMVILRFSDQMLTPGWDDNGVEALHQYSSLAKRFSFAA